MRKLFVILLPSLLVSCLSFAQAIAPPTHAPAPTLGDAARELRKDKVEHPTISHQGWSDQASIYYVSKEEKAEISRLDVTRDLLRNHRYQDLENEAATLRKTKKRLPGGAWGIYEFYLAFDGLNSEDNWQSLVNAIEQWKKAVPQSYTASIALAQAHIGWAGFERGGGYADTVSEIGWHGYEEHNRIALHILSDPKVMNSDDPYRYEELMMLGTGMGIEFPQMEKLFRKAVAAEPDFYHYYREYANYLQPKWNGEPGDDLALAERTVKEVGGDKGDFIYFEIASLVVCNCDDTTGDFSQMSWPRIKKGYEAMVRMYGATMMKRNRMALMAALNGDQETANRLFKEIGSDWEPSVWVREDLFEQARSIAFQYENNKSTATIAGQ